MNSRFMKRYTIFINLVVKKGEQCWMNLVIKKVLNVEEFDGGQCISTDIYYERLRIMNKSVLVSKIHRMPFCRCPFICTHLFKVSRLRMFYLFAQ